jgi:hypothetical protein
MPHEPYVRASRTGRGRSLARRSCEWGGPRPARASWRGPSCQAPQLPGSPTAKRSVGVSRGLLRRSGRTAGTAQLSARAQQTRLDPPRRARGPAHIRPGPATSALHLLACMSSKNGGLHMVKAKISPSSTAGNRMPACRPGSTQQRPLALGASARCNCSAQLTTTACVPRHCNQRGARGFEECADHSRRRRRTSPPGPTVMFPASSSPPSSSPSSPSASCADAASAAAASPSVAPWAPPWPSAPAAAVSASAGASASGSWSCAARFRPRPRVTAAADAIGVAAAGLWGRGGARRAGLHVRARLSGATPVWTLGSKASKQAVRRAVGGASSQPGEEARADLELRMQRRQVADLQQACDLRRAASRESGGPGPWTHQPVSPCRAGCVAGTDCALRARGLGVAAVRRGRLGGQVPAARPPDLRVVGH